MHSTVPSSNGNADKDELYISYGRISSLGTREAGNNLSAEHQERTNQQTADRHALKIGWWLSDEDVSGATFERKDWAQVVALIKSGEAAGVILWNQARASRAKAWHTLAMIEDIEAAGGKIYAQTGQITVSTFEGALTAFVNGHSDNKELEDKTAQLKQSVADAIERGAHLSAPYGYAKAPRERSRAMPIVINEEEQRWVELMCELRASGMSWPGIARELDERGSKPRPYVRHGKTVQGRWRHQAISQIVQSKTILGVAWNGELEVPGAHDPLVSEELWTAANKVRGVKHTGPAGGYVLTGLVRCTSCGYVMVHRSAGKHQYYKCLDQGSRKCPAPVNIPADALEAHVVERFVADYLGRTFGADEADERVRETEAAVTRAAAALRTALADKRDLAGAGAEAEEAAQESYLVAKQRFADAKRAHTAALDAARGVQLPDHLDEDTFRSLAPAEQNRWLSDVYAAVVVRKARVWREDVAGRARLLTVNEVGGVDADLIAASVGAL